jgi:flagellar basal-body rod protein FlgB
MSNFKLVDRKKRGGAMLNFISNNTNILEKTLDAAWKRNEVISNNIANVDTPQFKRSTVSFEDELNKALDSNELDLKTTDQRHISTKNDLSVKVTQDSTSLQYRLDGNNVDIESEMSDLAKNSIRYNTLIQKVSDEYKKLKYVISEGKR